MGLELTRGTERRLLWLMFARLALSLLSFAIALGMDGLGRELSASARQGLYWTVAFAFLATALAGAIFGRVRRPTVFAALQLTTDVAVVTSLVVFSGARESVFTFLYVAVTAYGAVLFERRGALAAASMSAAAYGAALAADHWGLLGDLGATARVHGAVQVATWGVHVGALFLVGALASVLTGELRRTGAALDRSTHDLRRLHNLHRRTVDSITSGLLTTDLEGNIHSFNPEAVRITGVQNKSVLGSRLEDLMPGAWDLITDPTFRGDEGVRRARLRYASRTGADLHLGVAGSELLDADGTPIGHVLIFQDVTNVVAMETDLRRSERLAAVGEMAAKIAHEIRNPLAAISGSVQVLRSEASVEAPLPQSPEHGRLMDIVVREADRLSGLISDFLDYARPRPLRRERVALSELIVDMLEVFEGSRPEDVELATQLDSEIEVPADPDQLRQLLWNLCINAAQAMPKGGRLSLCVRRAAPEASQGSSPAGRSDEKAAPAMGRWVEICVSDTGCGIRDEVQERLFEPFFTTKPTGTGLGLATVHRIVESHGGRLAVESEVDRGTTFRVFLLATAEGNE